MADLLSKFCLFKSPDALCPFYPAIKFVNHNHRPCRWFSLYNKMQTPIKSVCIKAILLCAVIISLIPNTVKRTGSVDKYRVENAVVPTVFLCENGGVVVGYHPLQKQGSIHLQCNAFDPEKALRLNNFFLAF